MKHEPPDLEEIDPLSVDPDDMKELEETDVDQPDEKGGTPRVDLFDVMDEQNDYRPGHLRVS